MSGPASAGVDHINAHGKEKFGGILECLWTETKGRIVRAARDFTQGEIILVENPLHIVQECRKANAFKKLKQLCETHDFDYEPLWYWCALKSLTTDQVKSAKSGGWSGTTPEIQRNLLLLHHDEVTEPGETAEILCKELVPSADALLLERLIQIWVMNCFEYSDSPKGYSTYFYSSFMSHSCFPNAVWHYTDADHVLRARRDICIGDEVCISYLPEDGLLQSAPHRRWDLHQSKHFWCDCERCRASERDCSRGIFCPKCKDGTVFPRTPVAGPAKSAALQLAGFVGMECSKCGGKVTKAESDKLIATETALQKIVEDHAEPTDENGGMDAAILKARETEKFIIENFSQHVLADLALEQLGGLYGGAGARHVVDQLRILKRRCGFHADAYPGLSGAHAWALEAYGDAVSILDDRDDLPQGLETAETRLTETMRLYNSALEILMPMFGEEHEYVTSVKGKLAELR